MGASEDMIPAGLDAEFIALCPTKGQLVRGAMELLLYLAPKYELHILSNGFKESQYIKMKCAGINTFFNKVVLAEECGWAKPDKAIFDFTLNQIGGNIFDSIMIGDDLNVDVLGAKHAGLDHVFLNRNNVMHEEIINHEIKNLVELMNIL